MCLKTTLETYPAPNKLSVSAEVSFSSLAVPDGLNLVSYKQEKPAGSQGVSLVTRSL